MAGVGGNAGHRSPLPGIARDVLEVLEDWERPLSVTEIAKQLSLNTRLVQNALDALTTSKRVSKTSGSSYGLSVDSDALSDSIAAQQTARKPKLAESDRATDPSRAGGSTPVKPISLSAEPEPRRYRSRCVACKQLRREDEFPAPRRQKRGRLSRVCSHCKADKAQPPAADTAALLQSQFADPCSIEPVGFVRQPETERPLDLGCDVLRVTVNTQLLEHLQSLVATGLWGRNIEDAAEQLISRAIFDLMPAIRSYSQ